MQMLMIKLGEDGGSMIPVFTDNIEFDKMPNDETVKKTIIDAKNLINFPLTPECDGFLINPMGVSLPLNAGIVNNLKNMDFASNRIGIKSCIAFLDIVFTHAVQVGEKTMQPINFYHKTML